MEYRKTSIKFGKGGPIEMKRQSDQRNRREREERPMNNFQKMRPNNEIINLKNELN